MIKKLIAATIVLAMLMATVPMSYADAVNNKHYNGWIGADSPLYGLKTGFQKLDLMLTFNNTEKFKKQMALTDEMLEEYQDAADENNMAALDTVAGDYSAMLMQIEETSQGDIDQAVYSDLAPMLYHHQEVFYTVMNDQNLNPDVIYYIQNRTMSVNNQVIKMKNGMPFYYYNGEQYFIPPGQMKKIENGSKGTGTTITNASKVPQGLLKKGYKSPTPTINADGSTSWPWDDYPYITNSSKKNIKGNGNGNGNGNNKK